MQINSNLSPFSTHKTVQKDGKNYLVVKGVSIVEGVLNKFLVPMDEFASFTHDWNGVPLVLRHPKQNNGSARVPNPDVPVLGNFYGAYLDADNRRLLGEYWFDEAAMLATNEGKDIYDAILAGKIIETSTGYYANIEDTPGVHNGLPYMGIQRNIHPDHIAVLPDEVGACSIRDGCGINRNSASFSITNCGGCMYANMTGNLPAEGKKIYEAVYKKAIEDGDSEETASKKAWGACKKAGWHKKGDEWVKANYAIYENVPFVNGGRGSGNFGHKGRPGLRGGSGSGGSRIKKLPKDNQDRERTLSDYAKAHKFYETTDGYQSKVKGTNYVMTITPDLRSKKATLQIENDEDVLHTEVFDIVSEDDIVKMFQDASWYGGELSLAEREEEIYKIWGNASTPDYSDSSMIAFMLPDEAKEKVKEQFPFIEDDTLNNLHLTLAFLGDTDTTDTIKALKAMFEATDYFPAVKGQVQGLARFISGGEQDAFVLIFDSPDLPKLHARLSNAIEWKGINIPKDHGFIPHITIAYVEANDDLPANTFEPFDLTLDHIALVNGNQTFLTVPLSQAYNSAAEPAHNSQAPSQKQNWLVTLLSKSNKEKKLMDKFKELVQKILNEAGWNVHFDDVNKTASAAPNSAPASPTLTGLESVVNDMGGVEKFADVIKNMANLPAQIQALSEAMNAISGDVKTAQTLAQNAAQVAETEKKGIVARMIANDNCPLEEAVLNGMDLEVLRKLEPSFQPTNYAALGGLFRNTEVSGGDETPLGVPSYFN